MYLRLSDEMRRAIRLCCGGFGFDGNPGHYQSSTEAKEILCERLGVSYKAGKFNLYDKGEWKLDGFRFRLLAKETCQDFTTYRNDLVAQGRVRCQPGSMLHVAARFLGMPMAPLVVTSEELDERSADYAPDDVVRTGRALLEKFDQFHALMLKDHGVDCVAEWGAHAKALDAAVRPRPRGKKMSQSEYKTTTGEVQWNDRATVIENVPDPTPPDNKNDWQLVGSTIGELRYSVQTIFWFWKL